MDFGNNHNILITFWHFITFRTYNNNLLTTGGASYLTLVFVIVTLVAFSEGVAWGYFGTSFTPENPLIGGICLGLFVFLILWFFDKAMATQDLLANEHAYTLEAEEKPPSFWLKYNIGTYFIFFIRLCIVIGSLYLTSDYLTQFVFRSDIDKEMQLQYKQNIENAKNNIMGKFDKNIEQDELYLKNLHDKLQKEIGGKRGTGYGRGEVAKSIETQMQDFQINLDNIKLQRQNTENTINIAIKNNDIQTLKTFGIEAVKDSPIFRQRAIDKFSQDPAFQKRKHTIEGLLAIFGIILILMKLLQPKSLKLYYSERLQEAWLNYQEGHYDDYLPSNQKSTNTTKRPMPQTFEKIIINYAQTKYEREEDEKLYRQKRMSEKRHQEQIKQEQENKSVLLEKSRQQWAENKARELQGLEYESKTKHHLKTQIEDNKAVIKEQMILFKEEHSQNIAKLKSDRQSILEQIADTTRIYQSKKEEMDARQEHLDNAQNKLIQLQSFAQTLEQKDRSTEGAVKSYTFTQDAIEEQKRAIKNLKNNWLDFDRDINFYEQKIKNLIEKKSEIEQELFLLKEKWDALQQAYHNQELAQIQLLGRIDLNTPYIHGTEEEIPHLAEKVKNDEIHYFYIQNTHQSNNPKIEHKDE